MRWALVGALLLSLGVASAFTDFGPVAQDFLARLGIMPSPSHFSDRARPAVLRAQARIDRSVPAGAVVLIGDSIAANAPSHGFANFGIHGQRSDQMLRDLPRSVHRARLIIVAIGTNDLWQWRDEGIEQRIAQLNRRVDAPIILTAIPMQGEAADRLNARLRSACAAGCDFVEPAITASDLTGDGIHLTPGGYRKWWSVILSHPALSHEDA